jgi:ubiquinone/menaquinone biosynthesis C-methylase UbiE
MFAQRVPEQESYDAMRECEAYSKACHMGLFKRIEDSFVQDIVKRFGHVQELRLLDVGTGPGVIPRLLSKKMPKWNITAVDHSAGMLDIARRYATAEGCHIRWHQSDAARLDFPSNYFDLVTSHLAFHEFSNVGAAIREMARVTRPNGTILVRDGLRPPKALFPLLTAWAYIYYALSSVMRKQAVRSLWASYRRDDFERLWKLLPFASNISTRWTVSFMMIEAHAIKPGDDYSASNLTARM